MPGMAARFLDQRHMPVMQRAHGGHQSHRFSVAFQRIDGGTQGRQVTEDLHDRNGSDKGIDRGISC
ncbi:hypothetical protein GCM10019071_39210 [Sphingobium fuliginis]|uniref:Uncharacterized protein n=1 Tax=Sphingobium fuliginis (strain ATCC 27551) TaxID=336203 RepID=A0ABQ1FBX8_SPHSA|nr:hypothetical protein GCM10019071_39210 [Sphingobium fuliginis]